MYACDESNFIVKSRSRYLVYGGVLAHESKLRRIKKGISRIRRSFKLKRDKELKWTLDLGSQTKNVNFKKAVFSLAAKQSVQLIVYVVPHAIAASTDNVEKFKFAFNVVIQQFERFLGEKENEHGLILSDKLDSVFKPKERERLERYLLQVYTWKGTGMLRPRLIVYPPIFLPSDWSFLHGMTDILIGGLRYAMNNRNTAGSKIKCTAIMKQIAPLFWKGETTGSPIGSGFNLYPKRATTPWHRGDLAELTQWVKSLAKS